MKIKPLFKTVLFILLSYSLMMPLKAQDVFIIGGKDAIYVSPIMKTSHFFSGLGVNWHQDALKNQNFKINVRYNNHDKWSPWYLLEADVDGIDEANKEDSSAFLPVNLTDTFQYRINFQNHKADVKAVLASLRFDYINAPANTFADSSWLVAKAVSGRKTLAQNIGQFPDINGRPGALKIISRAQWGADENLRLYNESNVKPALVKTESDFENKYGNELKIVKSIETDENGKRLTWPLKYPEKVTKIIIHHTASSKDLDDPARAINNIYYWHAATRGWGDIGYNYLIDQQGNIYEGRYGGDGVVGAHAGRGNIGSIGIAVLGNYEDSDVPDNVLKSLIALIKAKTEKFSIDPVGFSFFRGENLANIVGHRDVMSTTCPGEKLYAQLLALRVAVKSGFKPVIIDRGPNLAVNQNYDYTLEGDLVLPEFNPAEEKQISITLKNTGPTAWGPKTYLALNRDANAYAFFRSEQQVQSNPIGKELKTNETATLTLNLTSGYQGGFSAIEFVPVIDGIRKVEKYLSVPVQIRQPSYDYEITSMVMPKPYLKVGEREEVELEIKNNGNFAWKGAGPNKFTIGTEQPRDHVNKLLARNGRRLGLLEEDEVKPGQSGHLVIRLRAPRQTGLYNEYFTPLIEGVSWFKHKNNSLDVYVYEREYEASLLNKSSDTTFAPLETKKLWIELKNNGGVVWNGSTIQLLEYDIKNPDQLKVENILPEERQLLPGTNGKISFSVTVPEKEGFYYLQLKPRIGSNFLLQRGVNFFLKVIKGSGVGSMPAVISTQVSQTNVAPATNIRIDLSLSDNPVISASEAFALYGGQKKITQFQKNEKVSVYYAQSGYQVNAMTEKYFVNEPPRFIPAGSAILRIDNKTGANKEYRGILETRWYNNELHVINELPVEDYLKGTGEINEQEPMEKLKAIMIVARSYANFYVKIAEKFPGAPFHLTDDAETSQKYVGYSAEKRSPNTVKAVEDTTLLIVTYQGKPVKTPYFHSDDGRTRSAEEAWGWKDTPYLTSVPDPYCAGETLQGHGVGLSGCGSLKMAKAGKNYEEIIKYYYKGVEITKM